MVGKGMQDAEMPEWLKRLRKTYEESFGSEDSAAYQA